ncbi:hypothetical protein MRB53_034696 [Persea americana]|uniref:Uncharacterized protein n=1 Tax=Persea americana TaxID=3435 RepID=A0ACC2K2I3_PERAE|nr:hypothetical protein MRB53_034696 [Persea americana]|eukprot:TRINITY_DN5131_c0_g1_i3.p1 TRINITY_DN5131_c0_g1~~TRINITY_DN5131_c0_g1_i3.p1  ORF type:complete len:553 (+),score=127.73 TRINITY_DN5131_c0_g1_i3:141-1799(+)
MGVKNLWDILESCKKTLPLHHLQNKRVCVDLSYWLIQLQNVTKNPALKKDKIYLRNLFHRLRALIALNCSLIFVTDGSIPAIKLSTYRQRLGSSSEVSRVELNSQSTSSLPRNKGSEFSCMVKEAKILGLALGIPCLDGLEEAEAECALLNAESLCDGCFSADSDVFLFGAKTVYRDICLGESGYVICYEMEEIERKLGFGRNSLISLALLLGGDYSQGVHGIGPETACQIVKFVGDDNVLHRITSEGLAFAKKAKASMKQGQVVKRNAGKENGLDHKKNMSESKQNPVPDDHFMQVINAYLKPRCHLPESAAVQRVFIPHPFQRTKLQQICEQFFGWSPEITDEYILPKIAERDLRRFANLRYASSDLGVGILFHEIPVTCPVSAVLKRRKVHGRECFEVSWEKVDGLKTSTVPAELVESACPEKIAEFLERKDEENNQKRRSKPKKCGNKSAPNEIDRQLHELSLTTEPPQGITNQNLTYPSIVETEVIDLLTPSPPLRLCSKVTRCQQPNHQNVDDAIDVSESENEASPEHARKARELRLFLASINEQS